MIPAMIFLQGSARALRKLCKTLGALHLSDLPSDVPTNCSPVEKHRISSRVHVNKVVSVKLTDSIFTRLSEK